VGNSCEQSWSRKPADQTLGHQMPSASLMKALHSMEGALEQLITGDREDAVMDSREDCPGPAGTPDGKS